MQNARAHEYIISCYYPTRRFAGWNERCKLEYGECLNLPKFRTLIVITRGIAAQRSTHVRFISHITFKVHLLRNTDTDTDMDINFSLHLDRYIMKICTSTRDDAARICSQTQTQTQTQARNSIITGLFNSSNYFYFSLLFSLFFIYSADCRRNATRRGAGLFYYSMLYALQIRYVISI